MAIPIRLSFGVRGKKGKKEVVREKDLLETYNIHPINFVIARALEGDKSDNLKGVEGVGLKTVAKRFPFPEGEQRVHAPRYF